MSVNKKSITKLPLSLDTMTDEKSYVGKLIGGNKAVNKEEAWHKTDKTKYGWNAEWINPKEHSHTIIPQETYFTPTYPEGKFSEDNQINHLYQIINNQSQTIKALEEIVNKFKAEFLELKRSLGMCATCDNLSSPGDYLCPVCAKKESTV